MDNLLKRDARKTKHLPDAPVYKYSKSIQFTKDMLDANSNILNCYPHHQQQEYLSNGDTWDVKRRSKLHSILVHRYKGDIAYLEQATEEAEEVFKYIRPEYSATRKSGYKFHRRCLEWMFNSYEPSKLTSHQNEEDIQRMEYMSDVKNKKILAHALTHKFHCSYRQTSILLMMFDFITLYRGRMDYKTKNSFLKHSPEGTREKFHQVFKVLMEYKKVYYSNQRGTCRQWGLRKDVVEEYKRVKNMVETTRVSYTERIANGPQLQFDENAWLEQTLGPVTPLFYDLYNLWVVTCENHDKF